MAVDEHWVDDANRIGNGSHSHARLHRQIDDPNSFSAIVGVRVHHTVMDINGDLVLSGLPTSRTSGPRLHYYCRCGMHITVFVSSGLSPNIIISSSTVRLPVTIGGHGVGDGDDCDEHLATVWRPSCMAAPVDRFLH